MIPKKKFFHSLILSLFILASCSAARHQSSFTPAPTKQEKIRVALQKELERYPRSQLSDVYKNFFQDFFGPGHILADTAASGRYLRSELAETGSFDGPLYEPTGYNGNFYRVNISLIKDSVISYPEYFDAFYRSVSGITPPDPDTWRGEWRLIQQQIDSLGYRFDNEAADRALIRDRLESGDFAVHHSPAFNSNYEFHYRIISAPIFRTEILPRINDWLKVKG